VTVGTFCVDNEIFRFFLLKKSGLSTLSPTVLLQIMDSAFVGGLHETIAHYSFDGDADDCCRAVAHEFSERLELGQTWGRMGLGRAGTCSRTVNWWRGGRALLRLRLPGLHVGLWDQLRLLYGLRLRPDLSQWLWDCLRLLALLALNIVIVVVTIVFGRLRCSNQYCLVKMY